MIRLSSVEKIIISFLLFIVLMLTLRISYANNIRYAFLLWNLFLAWVPFQLSVTLTESANRNKWYSYFLLLSWLLFFPNALYIITDLVHLDESKGDVPVWFDAILLFTCSVAGLIMAFVSLYQVEMFLKKNISPRHTGKLVMSALFLGSFGVYVGRFLRWNSWSIITKPQLLFIDISSHLLLPFHHYKPWVVTLLLTCLFSLLYFALKKLPSVLNERPDANL
jgi:uncharacterized membrane protein